MLRILAIAAAFALAVPTLAAAQGNEHHPAGKGPPGKAGPPGPHGRMGGPPHGPMAGPHAGPGPGGHFTYHGHPFNRVHLAPFVYPPGWGYRRWGIGMVLPPLFLAPAYFYADWAAMGLAPPQPGFQWVRYGPDLVLVNVTTGQIVDVVYGAFY
jgi:hypothetical protein